MVYNSTSVIFFILIFQIKSCNWYLPITTLYVLQIYDSLCVVRTEILSNIKISF